MTCPQGHEAAQYRLPSRDTFIDVAQCAPCVRESVNGGAWKRMAGFCAGCDRSTWRAVTLPRFGVRQLLWPKPATRFALIATPDGPGANVYNEYCPACCPALGETPTRVVAEVDGCAIATAECVGFMERHGDLFTPKHGAWLWAHLADEDGYGLSEAERDAWLQQWEDDTHARAEAKSAALMETPHG